uniref:Gamma-interferon inducible lysosomal thiol reductase n=1 Tax=Globodera pallida TaxID=36090 RepID=A0A183CP93_GLOPA
GRLVGYLLLLLLLLMAIIVGGTYAFLLSPSSQRISFNNNCHVQFFTASSELQRLEILRHVLSSAMLYQTHHHSPASYARSRRYLSRPYLYPLFFLLVLFLLIRWNAQSNHGNTGARFFDDDDISIAIGGPEDSDVEEEVQIVKSTEEGEKRVIQKPPFLEEGEFGHKTTLQKKGNTVYLTVYMEAQCPDTTGFIRRQLLPAWSRLGATNRVNVSIVPFGKARCAQTEAEEGEDYRCECQHGQNECELNQLMNCAIEFLPDADSYVPLIGCVQGKESVSTAFKSCLAGHSSSDRDSGWLAYSRHIQTLLPHAPSVEA